MAAITPANIKSKFYPSIINRADFEDQALKRRVEEAFAAANLNKTPLSPFKPYVYEVAGLEGYVIKEDRTDQNGEHVSKDTNIYRVRKANKIQRIIDEYNLGQFIEVPQKYLYYHDNKWLVIAKKLNLSNEPPQINRTFWEEIIPQMRDDNGVITARKQRMRRGLTAEARAITSEQAKAITTIAFEAGLTDLTFENMYFSREGKIAIIDSEPIKRYFIKHVSSGWLAIFSDKGLVKLTQGSLGLAKLRLSIDNQDVVNSINETENYYLTVSAVKSIAKIAFLVIASFYVTAIPIAFVAVVLKYSIYAKISFIALQYISLIYVTYLARKPNGEGTMTLLRQELNGLI